MNVSTRTQNTMQAMVIDFVIIILAYIVVLWVRVPTGLRDYLQNFEWMLLYALIIIISLYLHRVYSRLWEFTSGYGVQIIFRASIIATALIVALEFFMKRRPLPLSVVGVGGVLAFGGFVMVRYRSRFMSGFSWRWRAILYRKFPDVGTRVLLVGAGESGQDLALRLRHRVRDNPYEIIGFVDDDPYKQNMYVEGVQVLGKTSDIPEIVQQQNIELIIISIHNITGSNFRKILTLCEQTEARIKVIPDVLQLMETNKKQPLLRDIEPKDLIGRNLVERHSDVDLSPVMNRVVLVTGAAGSIGSELSQQLATYKPTKLLLLDNNESGLHDLHLHLSTVFPSIPLVPILADITQKSALERIFERYRPQVLFHVAAYKHVSIVESYPEQAVYVNVGGTYNLAQLALENQIERFVLISTDKAVHPTSIMGASKRTCELIVHYFAESPNNKTLFTTVRFGNVLGSRGSVLTIFNNQIENGQPITITHPNMTRYFMSIPEAANLVIHAACMTEGDDIFILEMGEVVRIVDLAERMIRLRGLRPHVDIEIEYIGVKPGEKMHEELYQSDEEPLPTLHPHIVKVNRWDNLPDEATFRERLEALMQNCLKTNFTLKHFQEMWKPSDDAIQKVS